MKKNLHLFIITFTFLLPLTLNSQVTINNSIFPVAGDTLQTVAAQDAGGFNPMVTGENQEWDLRDITPGQLNFAYYTEPSEGEDSDMFPDADLLDKTDNQEIYYKSFNNKIVEIGRSGLDPVLNAISLTFTNEGEAVLRRAPMSFGDAYDDASTFRLGAPSSVIPDTLFPGLSNLIDSIRLTVDTNNDDIIDSWGTLRLPSGDFEVIRSKRTTTTNALLEVKAPFIGWSVLDENNPLSAALGDFADLLGENIVTSYQFFANDNKEIMADITYDDEGTLLSAVYKGDLTTSAEEVILNTADVKTYPNPTYGDVTFQLTNLPKDRYTIVVYNIIGKQLWKAEINQTSQRLNANLGHLRKGTYLYSILDSKGRKISTRRLMIMTP